MRRTGAILALALGCACAAGAPAAGAAPGPAPLAAATATALRAEGQLVRVGPVRFLTAAPVGRTRPGVVEVPRAQRRALLASAAAVRRGRGLVSPAALTALIAGQLATRPGARRVGADALSQAHERAATEALAADLLPAVLRRLGVRGLVSPLGADTSEAELSTQALWLRQVSTQLCSCPTGSRRARGVRARFLAASDPVRRRMVAGRFGVPLISGPYGD